MLHWFALKPVYLECNSRISILVRGSDQVIGLAIPVTRSAFMRSELVDEKLEFYARVLHIIAGQFWRFFAMRMANKFGFPKLVRKEEDTFCECSFWLCVNVTLGMRNSVYNGSIIISTIAENLSDDDYCQVFCLDVRKK